MEKIINVAKLTIKPIILLGIALIVLVMNYYVTFTPILNNATIVIPLVLGAFSLIWIIWIVVSSDIKTILKIIISLIITIIMIVSIIYGMLIITFGFKDNNTFEYKGKTYYYSDESWLDPLFFIYKKNNAITMTKVGEYYEYIPNEDKLSEETIDKIIKTIDNSLPDGGI